jgi:hypothetical protein
MMRIAAAILLCCTNVFPALAQDSRTFPGLDDLLSAHEKRKVVEVDAKALRKHLGAKDVKWDPKSGVLTLAYDFNKGQDKDWEIQDDCISRPTRVKGIRLAAATKIVHKVVFTEGSCSFQFAVGQFTDRGTLLSAGNIIVRQNFFNGREFHLNDKVTDLGNDRNIKQWMVYLACQENRCSLKVNQSEVAFGRDSGQPFQFMLHGGENGGEFGALTISGKPDSDWLAEFSKR